MRTIIAIITIVFLLYSCQADDKNIIAQARQNVVLDSSYTICKNIYLWNEALPNSIALDTFQNTKHVLEYIRKYSPLLNGKNIDRWSFAMDKSSWEKINNNETTDFGIKFSYLNDTTLWISQVYKNSDAFEKKLKRGIRIASVNGIEATFANKTQITKQLSSSNVLNIEFYDGIDIKKRETLYAKSFIKNSIIYATIIEKKIGYFVFDIFAGKNTINNINDLFQDFRQANVTDLVIDLRYNHGGDGNIALTLANLITPKESKGKVFTRIINNQKNSLLNYSLFFEPSNNNLDLKRVFFITSPETASASEALINSLEAVMEVKLIGGSSHGKPFGFFTIPIGKDYIFPIAFKNINANGYGDYYNGIPVDIEVGDDLMHDFGDIEESCLKAAIHYIKTGKKLQLKNNNYSNAINYSIEQTDLFYFSGQK